jgi:YbgC/YbaW family acyl-CoA thioester hydrolase
METTYTINVIEEHIDRLGHVNYNEYISYSERAIGDWYQKAGLTPGKMTEKRIGTVVVKLEVSYLKEALLGDVLKIVTSPKKLGNKSFVIKQDIYNQRDEHLTEFTKTFVMFDLTTRKGIPVIDEIARHFAKVNTP